MPKEQFLVQGAADLLLLWLFGLGSSTHRRFAAAVGDTSGRIDTGGRNRAKADSL